MRLYTQLARFVVSAAGLVLFASVAAFNAVPVLAPGKSRLVMEEVPTLIINEPAVPVAVRAPWRHMLPAAIGPRRG